jgi:hypothetical protein
MTHLLGGGHSFGTITGGGGLGGITIAEVIGSCIDVMILPNRSLNALPPYSVFRNFFTIFDM